jgi:hypothetical protein
MHYPPIWLLEAKVAARIALNNGDRSCTAARGRRHMDLLEAIVGAYLSLA